jgi:DNA-binding SARP family transcriptional activator/TolB-like protein
MLDLRTFGGLSVTADGASCGGAGARRKTLAILALLATSRKGLSRDKLIAYLWPESDTERGRNLLKQACFALRRDLQQPDLFLGATELLLNPAVITSDMRTFEDALQRGDPASAVAAYSGSFLDGFFLSDVAEFEHWVEAQRGRFAKQYCGALEALAGATGGRGDHRAAADWWRRLTPADPLSTRAAIGLMTALDDAGERAEAIRHGQAYEAFVRQQLGAEPASDVSSLIRRLQHGSDEDLRSAGALAAALSDPGDPAHPERVAAGVPAPLIRHVRRAHTLSLAAVSAVAVLLIGLTAYPVRRPRPPASGFEPVALPGRKMLVVLPFENHGATADEYFADGLTEAIATRLGGIQRLGVIAWPSARQYKGTRKSPQEIGSELGVQYILAGSVRWDKGPDTSRIRVSPTLIRVSDGAQLWAEQYDTTLTGVFAVQTRLATRVAGALDIALMDAERRLLEARQTTNLQAYDLYLRGRELVDREFVGRANVQAAVELYKRAVALDSNFAVAYDWLSVSYVWLHVTYFDRSPELLARAKAALDRGLSLERDLPESHAALGFYQFNVLGEYSHALKELMRARSLGPNDPYFAAVIADISTKQGHWDDALLYGREAAALDPLNVYLASGPALAYAELRQFTAAIYYYDRGLTLKPGSFNEQLGKAVAHLGQTADLAAAQRLLPSLSQPLPLDPTGGGVPIVSLCDIATLLDAERQTQLLTLVPSALEGDSAVLALSKAMVHRASNRALDARAEFDSARIVLENRVRAEPNDDYYAALLGLALAGLGRSAEAVREGQRAVDLVPISKDAEWAGYLHANLARIYVLLGERDNAVDELKIVLSRPGPLSAGWLRADPFWDPLRKSPRFQRLVATRN